MDKKGRGLPRLILLTYQICQEQWFLLTSCTDVLGHRGGYSYLWIDIDGSRGRDRDWEKEYE